MCQQNVQRSNRGYSRVSGAWAQHVRRSKLHGSHVYLGPSLGSSRPSHQNGAPAVVTSLSSCVGWAEWEIRAGGSSTVADPEFLGQVFEFEVTKILINIEHKDPQY